MLFEPFHCIVQLVVFVWVCKPSQGLKKMDRQLFLDLHNWYRAKFTRDTYDDQPVAADMSAMDWDEHLAWSAESLVNKCIGHEGEILELNKELSEVGIVSFSKRHDDGYSNNDYLKRTFNIWIKNSSELANKCDKDSVICDNIKQILYSKSVKMGCAEHLCDKNETVRLICLYNSRFNRSHPVFQHGNACSQCQENQPFCLDGSLCASKNQCKRKNPNSYCRCSIKSCGGRGIFKPDDCSCQCKSGYNGINCTELCQDKSENCANMQHFCISTPTNKEYMFRHCRQTCGFCHLKNVESISDERKSLVINTVVDPLISESYIDEETCLDKRDECFQWAEAGYCSETSVRLSCEKSCKLCLMKTTTTKVMNLDSRMCQNMTELCAEFDIQQYCPTTCGKYLKRMKNELLDLLNDIMLQDEAMCADNYPNCQQWKDQNYCHMENIQKHCLKTCKMCSNSGNSIICIESFQKKSACTRVKNLNLCSAQDMQKICPITCRNIKCQEKILEAATNIRRMGSLPGEPPQCLLMKRICHNPGVSTICPKTCASNMRSMKLSTPPTEPAVCSLMKNICNLPTVLKLCKKTCVSSISTKTTITTISSTLSSTSKLTSGSSKSSTPISTEPSMCSTMKDLCPNPEIANMCKITCGSSTASMSSSSGSKMSSTQISTEPTQCPSMKDLCTNPAVASMCKKTCGSSTTSMSSTSGSSISSTPISTEPTQCPSMKDLCTNPAVASMCKNTCGSSTTSISSTTGSSISSKFMSTEPTQCPSMKELCTNAVVGSMCKKTCGSSTTSISSTTFSSITPLSMIRFSPTGQISSTTLISSFTPISIEPSMCPKLKDLCVSPSVANVCVKTCASTTTVTSSSRRSSNDVTTEPTVCPEMKILCHKQKIANMCKKTCASTTTSKSSSSVSSVSSTSASTEPTLCPTMKDLCTNPAVAIMCKKTCASSTTSASSISSTSGSSQSSTPLSTEPTLCPGMKDLCINPSIAQICKKTCALTTTSKSSVSSTTDSSVSSTTQITEPTICPNMKELCTDLNVAHMCKKTCASSTTSKSSISSASISSVTSTPQITEPTICPGMKDLCINSNIAQMCKKTCALSTTSKSSISSTTGSSVSSTLQTTEPTMCPSMKLLCFTPTVTILCKKTCATPTTPLSSTIIFSTGGYSITSTPSTNEPTVCSMLKNLCSSSKISSLCKKTCAHILTTNSESSVTSGTSSSVSTEDPKCENFKDACSIPQIAKRCKKTCATTSTTSKTTTKCSETIRRTAMCKILKTQGFCNDKLMRVTCPITCGICV